ncbi:MAG: flagellar type III secretion system pore protein FliP [Planctomycetota bacterium]|jgi:flagellar biosynthetic protein FliP
MVMLMRCLTVVLTLLLCLAVAGSVQAQSGSKTSPGTGAQPNPTIGGQAGPGSTPQNPTIGGQATNPQSQNPGSQGPSISLNLSAGSTSRKSLGSAIEIVLLMTLLALAPAIMLTMTCFTRIVIVLSFLKRAMSMQDLPPAVVVTGFSLFMTIFIMKPVISDIYENAYMPYVEEKEGVTLLTAADQASQRLSRFMLRQTREADLQLILDLTGAKTRPNTPADTPFHVVVPAFILSEIKTAFQMGFVLFLPFVIIDLVIASLLVSMGMFTLPPIVVSTPMKLLLFVMVDGWGLVVGSLAQSFGYQP